MTSTAARPFAPTSVWNAPLPAETRASALSSTYVSTLLAQVKRDGAWINTYSYSVPVYVVSRQQPRVSVTLDTHGGSADELAASFRAGVPIPARAEPAAGTDEHLVVWEPSIDTMWEFWHMHQVSGIWHARWGGVMRGLSTNPGYFTHPSDWGATATSLPLLGGLMRVSELRSGHIDHALALALPRTRAHDFVFPAQRSDGNDASPAAIPEGTEFRLDPGLDIASLHLSPVARMMAVAAQKYGIIVRDQSGAVSFYGEAPTGGTPSPYAGRQGLFGGENAAQVLQNFPWQHLVATAARSVG